jgi:hypothetical protein
VNNVVGGLYTICTIVILHQDERLVWVFGLLLCRFNMRLEDLVEVYYTYVRLPATFKG